MVPNTRALLQRPDRRRFLCSLAALGLATKVGIAEKQPESVYRFQTSACEVRMSVQYFASSSIDGFRFRDDLTNRTFSSPQTESRTGIAWSDSWDPWPSPSTISVRGVTPELRSIFGSAC
jgi:hypothetical protein